MKAYVDVDELYPYYDYSPAPFGVCDEIEVDGETLQRWREAFDAFHAVQAEIKAAVERAHASKGAGPGQTVDTSLP